MTRSELCARVAARSSLSKADVAARARRSDLHHCRRPCRERDRHHHRIRHVHAQDPRGSPGTQSRHRRARRHPRRPGAVLQGRKGPSRRAQPIANRDRWTAIRLLSSEARTRYGSAFTTALRRPAEAPPWLTSPDRVQVQTRRLRFRLATCDRVTFGAGRSWGETSLFAIRGERTAQTGGGHRLPRARGSLYGEPQDCSDDCAAGQCARLMHHLLPSRFRRLPTDRRNTVFARQRPRLRRQAPA